MPKQVSQQELDIVLQAISEFPQGAGIEEIMSQLKEPLPKRTLQRRLSYLLTTQQLSVSGQGRASRYQLSEPIYRMSQGFRPNEVPLSTYGSEMYFKASRVEEERPTYIKRTTRFSPASMSLQEFVRQPLHQRPSVNYNPDFLKSYQPNETFYLSQSTRDYLWNLGHSPRQDNQPAGTFAKKVYQRLLIDLTWNSSRLEGNTYTLLETELLLQLDELAENKSASDARMILNHKEAINFIIDCADIIKFNRATISNLHALLSKELLENEKARGQIRQIAVGIGRSSYNPLQIPQLLEENFLLILEKAAAIQNPFEQSFFAMVHIPYLQPFEDVNKRTSRLAANIPLIQQNLCPLSFVNVSDQEYVEGTLAVYELNRIELLREIFVWAYERSCNQYAEICHTVTEPSVFSLRYHREIIEAGAKVVRDVMNKKTATQYIQQYAEKNIAAKDRNRFIEKVETELMSLHEGSYACFRLRPNEFEIWHKQWK